MCCVSRDSLLRQSLVLALASLCRHEKLPSLLFTSAPFSSSLVPSCGWVVCSLVLVLPLVLVLILPLVLILTTPTPSLPFACWLALIVCIEPARLTVSLTPHVVPLFSYILLLPLFLHTIRVSVNMVLSVNAFASVTDNRQRNWRGFLFDGWFCLNRLSFVANALNAVEDDRRGAGD